MAKWKTDREGFYSRSVMSMVKEFSEIMGQKPDPLLYETLVAEEYREWSEARPLTYEGHIANVNKRNELKELADLLYVVYGYANARGWDLDEAVRRVHQNNIGRCVQPDGSILRNERGKILKNPNYEKVELGDLV